MVCSRGMRGYGSLGINDVIRSPESSRARIAHPAIILFGGLGVKGALYRIWCGVNRLGDSGVKVV